MNIKAISLNVTDETTSSENENALGFEASGLPANPFVGLRPFLSTEGLLFFGRREQAIELLQQLHRTRFLAVVGSSGCGKSSLIRAGLIPKVHAGFLVERRDQWRIATMKPGDSPLQNLASALLEACSKEPTTDNVNSLVEAIQDSGMQAIIDFLIPQFEKPDTNILLLVDQFEEIFRFGLYEDKDTSRVETEAQEKRRDEAADFVSIMLGLAQQQALPIYVVMTMRSDFLGDCDAFYGLPEAMNRSQYLVPRLTRQQRKEAIESPIRLYGQEITPGLLDRVLNDVGEESDQLPVMQHALMRTWEKWREEKIGVIDIPHYIAIGTIKNALSQDADSALGSLGGEDRITVERLFQALTKTDAQGRRLRRPARLTDLQAITGASREKVLQVIERFRSQNRDFLTLSTDRLTEESLVDISHESLIRQWETLRKWVDAEVESKEQYVRLAEDAVRHKSGWVSFWIDPALQLALDWREKRQPNQAWAQRYHPEFELTMAFLDNSKAKHEQDAANAERFREEQAERERKELERVKAFSARQRIYIRVLAFLMLLVLALGFYAYLNEVKKNTLSRRAVANENYYQARRYLEEDMLGKAKEKYLESIAAYKASGNELGAADTYEELGEILLEQKESTSANEDEEKEGLKFYEEAVKIYQKEKSYHASAAILHKLGEHFSDEFSQWEDFRSTQERIELARKYLRAAFVDAGEAKNLNRQILVLTQIGDSYADNEDQTYGDSKDNTLANSNNESRTPPQSAAFYYEQTLDPQSAAFYYEQTLELYRNLMNDQPQDARRAEKVKKEFFSMMVKIGKFYQQHSSEEKAKEFFNRAVDIYRLANDSEGTIDAYIEVGSRLPDKKQDAYFQQAIKSYREAGKLKEEAHTLKQIGQYYGDSYFSGRRTLEYPKAIEYFKRALSLYEELEQPKEQAIILYNIGLMQAKLMKYDEALKSCQAALKCYLEEQGLEKKDLENQARVYFGIAFLQDKLKQTKLAVDSYREAHKLYSDLYDEQKVKEIAEHIKSLEEKLAKERSK